LCFYFYLLHSSLKKQTKQTKKVRIIFLDDKNNKKKNSIINIWSNHFVFYFRFIDFWVYLIGVFGLNLAPLLF
jgi:hypothetical protein